MTSGLVTAVDGSTITVTSTAQDGTTSTKTVTVDDSTTYTTTQAATADALTAGRCVMASGTADSSGGYAATALVVSDKGADGCTQAGPGGGRPGGTGSDSGTGTGTNGGGA